MSKSFFNRVEAEREVLSLVNSLFSGRRQLAGLSSAAIEDWLGRTGFGPKARQHLLPVLRDLADSCQKLSDRSHETFAPINPVVGKRISIGMQTLSVALEHAFVHDQ